MTEFFPHTKGGFTIYAGGSDVEITDVRFVLANFGEDAAKVIEQFWKERCGDFVLVPVFAYGGVPRRELCTQQSLVAALQTVAFDPNGFVGMKWRKLCQEMNVALPKRLAA
jgi:hypothetical protein